MMGTPSLDPRHDVIEELRAMAEKLAPAGRDAVPGFCGTMTTYENGKTTGPLPIGLYSEEKMLKGVVAIFRRMLDAAEGIELFQPGNGTEGEIFMSRWCARCTKDNMNHDTGEGGCEIIGLTMALDVDDEDYPRQWRSDGPKGPRCTAFEAKNG